MKSGNLGKQKFVGKNIADCKDPMTFCDKSDKCAKKVFFFFLTFATVLMIYLWEEYVVYFLGTS